MTNSGGILLLKICRAGAITKQVSLSFCYLFKHFLLCIIFKTGSYFVQKNKCFRRHCLCGGCLDYMQSRRHAGSFLLCFTHALESDNLGWRDLWSWEDQSLVPCRAVLKIRAGCSRFVCLMQTKKENLYGWRFCSLSGQTVPLCK